MEVPDLWRNRRSRRFRLLTFVALAMAACAAVPPTIAQSCTTQAEMDAATRNGLEQSALATAQQIAAAAENAAGNAALQSRIAPQVAQDAAGILNSIASAAPLVKGASFLVENLYVLDATKVPANGSSDSPTQFFCGSMNEPPHVIFTLGHLPQARYAIAMVHAMGIAKPQQMTIIFAQSQSSWKLAGFAYRPVAMAGHDGVWYWKQARVYAQQKQNWDAYLYYKTAQILVTPVDFVSSSNLNKLMREEDAVKPAGLPGQQPMELVNGAQKFSITSLHTDSYQGGLDLVIHYQTNSVQDPVATRQQNLAVMHLMLQAHPELRQAFHGIWVYADATGQTPFGIELPMTQIP